MQFTGHTSGGSSRPRFYTYGCALCRTYTFVAALPLLALDGWRGWIYTDHVPTVLYVDPAFAVGRDSGQTAYHWPRLDVPTGTITIRT